MLGLFESRFYDKPDGHLPFQKLLASMKLPVFVSCSFGMLDSLLKKNGRVDTYATFGNILKRGLPLCGLSLFFTTGTFAAARIRNKDDPVNHVIGAIIATPLIRKYLSLAATMQYATIFIIVAYAAKDITGHPEYRSGMDDIETIPRNGTTFDWWEWSKAKPAGVGYLKYD